MILNSSQKNKVMQSVIRELEVNRAKLIETNRIELDTFTGGDQAMYDRLKITEAKIDGMIKSLQTVIDKEDPVGKTLYSYDHPNGLKMKNRTASFGRIMIIYESRPDVTIEAACIAFKSGNKILLKGGKESRTSNLLLVSCWQKALTEHGQSTDWVEYLDFNREQTQAFLRQPTKRIDLIVPRGGEGLINFVKTHATCPVLVSGRGNNFMYIESSANWDNAVKIILNAKLDKISACNALDKILIDTSIPSYSDKLQTLISALKEANVTVHTNLATDQEVERYEGDDIMYEEFLDYKIAIDTATNVQEAISKINTYSGGHSATIITEDQGIADQFMASIDAAAVYHNASTRFTDGGEMGLGAELAISTDKLHHRGPLGLDHLVTNKWYVYGNGQIRK